jgi:hypothetical protein
MTQHSDANNTMIAPVRYSDVLAIRMEPRLREAIQAAAAKYGVKEAEYVRNALWTAIALQGSEDTPDVRDDGKRRYAHLIGGAVVDIIYAKPAT